MSELDMFYEACSHFCFDGVKKVLGNQMKLTVEIQCSHCGKKWCWKLFDELKSWKLFGELKNGKPDGYYEWLFKDEKARVKLGAFVNGMMLVEDEVEE